MKNEDINAFLDAVDKSKAGDEKAFDGMNIALDGDDFIVNPPLGAENKHERKRQDD